MQSVPSTEHSQKPVLFSGIQPSGILGLGHYLGAIRHWLALQKDYECYFSIVDLHTLTVRQDPRLLRQRSLDTIAMYLACGLDPKQSCLFLQSSVDEHAHLAWILSCQTMIGELNRMTQFKDKSSKYHDNINAGLFTYPALMSADILLYDTDIVPVGDDQRQHLELARDLAQRFNHHYGQTFTRPKPWIAPVGSRIMGLSDPEKKMSKSDDNTNNVITLLDSPKDITKKIKAAVTDSQMCIEPDAKRPGITNLIEIYRSITQQDVDAIVNAYQGKGYGHFKADLIDQLVMLIKPITEHYKLYRQDEAALMRLLESGQNKARERASKKCQLVYERLGLLRL